MPFIDVTIAEGRSPEVIRTLIHELHEATRRAIDAPVASIRVVIREVPLTHWAAGDQTLAEKRQAEQGTQKNTGDPMTAPRESQTHPYQLPEGVQGQGAAAGPR